MEFQPESHVSKKPPWLKVRFPSDKNFFYVSSLIKEKQLNTICRSARCPNISECWSHKTATFLILGNICTRDCAFCAVQKGTPQRDASDEASQVAEAVMLMGLQYAVITSVTRDDLDDGGAQIFAETIKKIREKTPQTRIEVLIPDFKGEEEALSKVIAAEPDILNHNLEVPSRLYPQINRPSISYARSLKVLKTAAEKGMATKSGLMIGLGEKTEDILQAFSDLRKASCQLLTIGQYLQPTKKHIPVRKYYSPNEFDQFRRIALDFGFRDVVSGPLVRSSYRAHKMYESFHQNMV